MRDWFSSWFTALFWLCLAAWPHEVYAQSSIAVGTIQRYTLPNGLRVVLNPLPNRTSSAVCVTYLAGSGLEQEGQSGIASLVERLMTQGSRNVEANDHARLLTERAAVASSAITE